MSTIRPAPLLHAARLLAAVQSLIWLALLVHGGWGLIFAPLALLAAVIGGRHPAVGPLLLGPPVGWLAMSWAPILGHAPTAADWTIWGLLIVPASLAAAAFLVAALPATSTRSWGGGAGR